MARTKQVFPRDEVAHLWAHKAQDNARDASGNFYFTGPTIYSYGAHFAMGHILSDECGPALAGRVLVNDESRSNTTSKHQHIMRQAMTRQQWETALHVPGMNETSARGIDRALSEKRLPDKAVELLRYIRENVAALAGKKHGSGPFMHALQTAVKYESVALAFHARAGRKYPLPIIGHADADCVPSDKVERDAFILTFARADLERQYRENLKHAQDGLAAATDARDNPDTSADWYMHSRNAQGARDRARNALASANMAQTVYGRLHGGKQSRAAQSVARALTTVFSALEKRVTDAEAAEKRERIERAIKRYAHARGMVRKGSTAYHHINGLQESVYHASGIASEAQAVGIPADSWMHGVAAKMARAYGFDAMQRELKRTQQHLETGDSFYPRHMGDAKREYGHALRKLAHINKVAAEIGVTPAAFAYFAGWSLVAGIEQATARMADIDARIAAENAERVRAWIAGESDAKPASEAGTFARINRARGVVETTRSASVPIEHACRLARMYAIGVRRGGQTWPDGAGPMVGHYRVNEIGADGSLVIGCHEFTPAEAKRLHTLLESCAECATVTA